MNIISFYKKETPDFGRSGSEDMLESIYPYAHELNITDGGEFLDDAIRMNDQPLGERNTIKK